MRASPAKVYPALARPGFSFFSSTSYSSPPRKFRALAVHFAKYFRDVNPFSICLLLCPSVMSRRGSVGESGKYSSSLLELCFFLNFSRCLRTLLSS